MLNVLARVIFIYIILISTMRLMGKRQIGELQLSELVTTILLSELASQPITDEQIPLAFAIIPVATLLCFEIIISFAVTKVSWLKPIFDGKPSILIRRGKLDQKELVRVRISLEELLSSLRIAGASDISEVDYAILEQNGQLSVFLKKRESPPNRSDMNINTPEAGIAHAVIVDSKISDYDLKLIGKDRRWLEKRLAHHKTKLDKVFLFSIDDAGKETILKKQ